MTFAAQRNFSLQHVKTKWILYIDEDERMNDELIANISKAAASGKQAMFRLERRNSAFARDLKYGVLGTDSDSVVRLLPSKGVQLEGKALLVSLPKQRLGDILSITQCFF